MIKTNHMTQFIWKKNIDEITIEKLNQALLTTNNSYDSKTFYYRFDN
jgi:hypothetical protein